jgi:hypothetical protein
VDVVANLDLLADVDTTGTEAPTNGQALVYESASGLWKPATIAGGGGAAVNAKHITPPPLQATSAGGAGIARGQRFLALADATVTSFAIHVTGVAGKTYRLGLFEMTTNGTILGTQVGSFVDVASPGTGKQKISSGTVAWNIDGGKVYAFTIHVSDSSNVAVYNAGTTAAGSPGMFLCVPPAHNGTLQLTVVPAVGAATTTATGSYETEILAHNR